MSRAKVSELFAVIPAGNILGENVLWHQAQQALYWIDIEGALLQRYQLEHAVVETFVLPQRVGSFAFLQDGGPYQLVVAFACGFALYNFQTGATKWLDKPLPESANSGLRFNDGRVDRQGRFWAGTMVEDERFARQSARLYQLAANGSAIPRLQGLTISNGLCWSLDGRLMYHADSPKHQILQYQFCPETGHISQPQLFARTPDNAHPDGSAIDAQGYLWSAHWGAGQVVRYAPDGHIDLVLTLPVSQPSSVALCGPKLDLLAVTSSSLGLTASQLAAQPQAGHLFIYQLSGVQGVAEPHCHCAASWLSATTTALLP